MPNQQKPLKETKKRLLGGITGAVVVSFSWLQITYAKFGGLTIN